MTDRHDKAADLIREDLMRAVALAETYIGYRQDTDEQGPIIELTRLIAEERRRQGLGGCVCLDSGSRACPYPALKDDDMCAAHRRAQDDIDRMYGEG